jgi:hypothetical protein
MKFSYIQTSILIILAIAFHVGVNWLWLISQGHTDPDSPGLIGFLYSPLAAIASIASPFLLGLLIKHHGFSIGAIVGAVAGPLQLCLISYSFGGTAFSFGLVATLLSSAIGSSLLSSVSCAAGVLASRQLALTTQSRGPPWKH